MELIIRRTTLLLLLNLLSKIQSSYGISTDHASLFTRSSGSCPDSYNTCGDGLPDNFCCPSTSTCISLDSGSSAICCPAGASCDYISPIVCNIGAQDASSHPKNPIKTTNLNATLSTCGTACCPLGYTCQSGSLCALIKDTSHTATSKASDTTSATSLTATESSSVTITPVLAPVVSPSSTGATSSNSTTAAVAQVCNDFPTNAIIAGFFPGAIFGAVLCLLVTICLRRRAEKKNLQRYDPKSGIHWSQRSSSGAVLGISGPIPNEDNSYRTDFLLRSSAGGRSSISSRSMLSRTGSRVRSLFSGQTRPSEKEIPPVPQLQGRFPVAPPRRREPSTESIKVYSPPGAFSQSRKFLGPEPYPGGIARPDTTFSDLVQAVGLGSSKGEAAHKFTDVKL
ncbi:hypothetical protein N7539_001285 [Penicillium diatomitis]|uniref:Uncharacterized protein n=1 Tax=Penicillium diatomitis TaxID=2819901 RepID=A0A9W9XGN6_9EURO|nr:uncharacterized protein N7539_001285 [Penicillium diatomitis]KAJ5492539.1 hypothetical protein N7539_001285 [Penicillium diatomitis]